MKAEHGARALLRFDSRRADSVQSCGCSRIMISVACILDAYCNWSPISGREKERNKASGLKGSISYYRHVVHVILPDVANAFNITGACPAPLSPLSYPHPTPNTLPPPPPTHPGPFRDKGPRTQKGRAKGPRPRNKGAREPGPWAQRPGPQGPFFLGLGPFAGLLLGALR